MTVLSAGDAVCTGCNEVYYCSYECQRSDWVRHAYIYTQGKFILGFPIKISMYAVHCNRLKRKMKFIEKVYVHIKDVKAPKKYTRTSDNRIH